MHGGIKVFIIVGLGNPGREYENTRHNVGFMTVDMLADRFNIEVKRHNFRAVFGEGYIGRPKGSAGQARDLYEPFGLERNGAVQLVQARA